MEKAQAIIRFILALAILTGIISVFAWANCNDKKSYQQPVEKEQCPGGPATIDHGTALEWGWYEDYPKKGKAVTFEGYVEMPNLTYLNGGTYLVNLLEDSTLEGRSVTMQIKEGDCENTMLPIPSEYEASDLLIYDNAGKKIVQGDKIRMTGKVNDDGPLYIIFVKRIEKIH